MKYSSCTPSIVGILCASAMALSFTLRAEAAPAALGDIQALDSSAIAAESGTILLAENIIGDGGRFDFETADPATGFVNGKKKGKGSKDPKKKTPKKPKMPKQPKEPKEPKAPKATKQKKQKKEKKQKQKKQKKQK